MNFEQMFPLGDKNDAFAQYFIGQSYNAPLVDGSVPVNNISFEPGCRNNWHIHHGTDGGGDQILICTAGSGWYQAEGEDPVSMEPGTVDPRPGRHQALARRKGRLVVLPPGLHHPRRGCQQRMARAGHRRGL